MKLLSLLLTLTTCTISPLLAAEGTPKEQATALYNNIATKAVEAPFTTFFTGSLMFKQKAEQVKAMDAQAKSAFEYYGPPTAIEFLKEDPLGESLVKLQWITKHNDETPLFWKGLFYKRNGQWEPLGIFFYDDPTQAGI